MEDARLKRWMAARAGMIDAACEGFVASGVEFNAPRGKYSFLMNRTAASCWAAIRYRDGQLTMEEVYASKYLPSQIATVDLIGVTREV